MDRYQEFVVFDAVVTEGGFAGAARRLKLSASTVTRCIASLEVRYQVQAFNRSTRGVDLTEAGNALHERVRRLLDDLSTAESSSIGLHQGSQGNLTIAAPSRLGRQLLLPIIAEFLKEHPGTTIDARFLDRPVNLHEEGIDIAVQAGVLADSSNIALSVGSIRRVVVAGVGYQRAYGSPRSPDDLVDHQIIQSTADAPAPVWVFDNQGEPRSIHLSPTLIVSNNDAAIDCALEDFGLTRVMSYQVAQHLAEGRLIAQLEEFQTRPIPLHVLYREGRRAARRIRTFVDYAAARLRAAPGVGSLQR